MNKYWKIIVLIIILAGLGALLAKKYGQKKPQGRDIETIKNEIIADPKILVTNLTEDQKKKFIADFQSGKDTVLGSNFDSLQGLNRIALAKQHLGDFDGAVVAWKYANVIRPKNSLSFSNLAALYQFDLKQYDQAEENYKISLENDPDDFPTIRNFFELYHYAIKDDAKAEALLLRSIEQNPQAQDLYSLAGSFYAEIGKYDQAIEYYQKHLELYPKNQAVQKELARLRALIKK